MATLAEALRTSTLDAAYCEAGADCRVAVRRELAGRKPGGAERYIVTVQRGPALPEPAGEAPTLDEALATLRALRLPEFDPDGNGWQPATGMSEEQSSVWSDDAASRSLPPMVERFDPVADGQVEIDPNAPPRQRS